jgi:hypothetical protein
MLRAYFNLGVVPPPFVTLSSSKVISAFNNDFRNKYDAISTRKDYGFEWKLSDEGPII